MRCTPPNPSEVVLRCVSGDGRGQSFSAVVEISECSCGKLPVRHKTRAAERSCLAPVHSLFGDAFALLGWTIRKGASQPMATGKPRDNFGPTRRTWPRALSEAPASIGRVRWTVSSTEEPSRGEKSLNSRIPDLAYVHGSRRPLRIADLNRNRQTNRITCTLRNSALENMS